MAGAMNPDCAAIRPVMTEHLMLGMCLPAEVWGHLTGCTACAHEAAEIGDVVRTLARAENGVHRTGRPRATPQVPPVRAVDMPPPRTAGSRRGLRRRLVQYASVALLTAAALAAPFALHDRGQGSPGTVSIARQGRMISQPWGTEVPVALNGLRRGETYRLMAADFTGLRVPGGSVRTMTGEPVHAQVMTALSREAIKEVIVEDTHGRVVGRVSTTGPPPTTA
ncbi:hypothetical protein OG760_22600 [Streptomyces sp. NBC_00963]|uniref:hypothetical protein n=1 Tax=Streptomyces sp. NBC_00963 TaxID=2903697 RepID=UPI00386A3511|nr:hypothetical protein OG760_22600 [Streptomyces sp. NBC_00963]